MPGAVLLNDIVRLVRESIGDLDRADHAISTPRLHSVIAHELVLANLVSAPPQQKVDGILTFVADDFDYDLSITSDYVTYRNLYILQHRASGKILERTSYARILHQLSQGSSSSGMNPGSGRPREFAVLERWDTAQTRATILVHPPPSAEWAGPVDAYRSALYDTITRESLLPIEPARAHAIAAAVAARVLEGLSAEQLRKLGSSNKVAGRLSESAERTIQLDAERATTLQNRGHEQRRRGY